jgi:hypothetical protein
MGQTPNARELAAAVVDELQGRGQEAERPDMTQRMRDNLRDQRERRASAISARLFGTPPPETQLRDRAGRFTGQYGQGLDQGSRGGEPQRSDGARMMDNLLGRGEQ